MGLVIYTDESGTHDNRYLVIAALITVSKSSRNRIKRVIKSKTVKYSSSVIDNELHASKLSTAEKQDIVTSLSKRHDYFIAYIVADKNHLSRELKIRSNLCYNYLFSVLFKKIVAAFGSHDIKIIADNRTVSAGSKNSLPEYIMTEAYANWGYSNQLSINFCDSRDVKGLQAVDIIANSIYAKYELSKHHLYNMHKNHVVEVVKFPYAKFGK